ncbi:hypothetical protein GCM10009853_016830 [Glycomyces scopariae]
MTEGPGRRERKKQQTRDTLIATAARLFQERGYEATGVADIAEAADVSKRTFFLHFPTKEDVLLSDGRARLDLAIRVIEERAPGTPLRDALAASLAAMIDDTAARDLPTGMAALRARLIVESPAVQARVLHTAFAGQARIADALLDAYPDELDRTTAAAVLGAVVGAVSAAAMAALREDGDPAAVTEAMRRAAAIALTTLNSLGD